MQPTARAMIKKDKQKIFDIFSVQSSSSCVVAADGGAYVHAAIIKGAPPRAHNYTAKSIIMHAEKTTVSI